VTTLQEAIEKRRAQLREPEPVPPSGEYVKEFTVTPTSFTREEKQVLRQRREGAKTGIGFPSAGSAKELVKEGVVTGTAGMVNLPLTLNALAGQAMAALLPVGPVKRMAEAASGLEQKSLAAIEPVVRGVTSGRLESVPSPMVPKPGERLPEMLPPETLMENVLYRGGQFFPEAITAATATRALLGQVAPGIAGVAAGAARSIPGAAGSSLGLGGVSVIGEEVGGLLGRPLGAEESGRLIGRLSAELLGGTATQAGGRALVGTAAENVLKPLYRPAMAAVRRVFDGTALEAMRGGTVQGMDRVQARLDQFMATREGQRLAQALAGRKQISEEIVSAAEKAMADAGLPLTIDLATRSGADEMRNLVEKLERKSEAMRARKTQQELQLEEGMQRLFDQASASQRQGNLHRLSRESLDQIIRRQDTKISEYEKQMGDIVRQVGEGGATFESVGRQMREILTQERNSMRQKFQAVYQRLDNDGNTFSAQLPGGGYQLDNILGYLEMLRTQQPTLFDRVHGAITRYDRQAKRYLLKEDPTTSADNMPDAGEFPEIMSADEIGNPASAQADAASKARNDAEAYKGLQEYPAGPIGVDISKYKPVSFQTLRHLRRDAGFALRSSPPELRGPLLELQRLIDAELAEKTPELFDAFKMVQERYATDYIGTFQRGVTGKVLASNYEGVMTMLDNQLLKSFWDAGAQGAAQARALGIDQMTPNPLLTISLRQLAKTIGSQDPVNASAKFDLFIRNNQEFLDAAGLTPHFADLRTSMETLNDSLRLAREESKLIDKQLLTRLIKSLEIPIGDRQDVGDVLRAMTGNPEDRAALTRMMSSPGMGEFRDAVLDTLLESLRAPRSKKPFEEMVALQSVLRPLYATKSPDAFDKALAFAAVVQARRMTPPSAFPQGLESIASQDPVTQAIGTSSVAILGRARSVVMGYMSKLYAGFDILSRYGIKVSRERADQLLMDAIYDPQAANALMALTFAVDRPNVSFGAVNTAVKKWNQYAIENGLTVLLFETTERSPTPEPLPEVY
jgi:hypothetical protein